MNTALSYQYTDGANHRCDITVVLRGILTEEQKAQIQNRLAHGNRFIPGEVGLPEIPKDYWADKLRLPFPTEHDTVWHVLERLMETEELPTTRMTAQELYERFAQIEHWDEEAAAARLGLDLAAGAGTR